MAIGVISAMPEQTKKSKCALIFGATGAVGRQLLDLCLTGDHYQQVIVIARRPAVINHKKLHWIETNLTQLHSLEALPELEHGDSYCCLGTTIKTAGSKAAFRQVDYDYVLEAAKFSKRCGINHFSLITAIGASKTSPSFYSRVKGETEAAVIEEAFPQLSIFRPSLLEGERDEFRLKEALASWISLLLLPVFYLGLRKYQPIKIHTLARAIYQLTNEEAGNSAVTIYESDQLQRF